MKQYKLQLTISEEANSILNQLHRFHKGRFVELAIKWAYQNKDIKNNFAWNNENSNNIKESQEKSHSKSSLKNKNLQEDDLKDPKIDHRW